MNIIPKDGPTIAALPGAQTQTQQNARERAIAKLTAAATPIPADMPVQNPSNISVEELGAIKSRQNYKEEAPAKQEETIVEEPKAAKEETLSSQYAILARQQKALRQRDQQLKAREAAIKAQEDAARLPQKPLFDESKYVQKDRITQDPFAVLNELGLSYDQLTDLALNAPKPEQIAINNELKALREEMKLLRGENESTKKSFEEQQTQAYTQAVQQIRNEAKLLVNNNPNFETIKETSSINDVVELIEQTFKQDGILLTVEEAAQQVEDYLVEEAMKITKIKKIQQRLMPKATPVAEAQKTTDQPKQQQMKTLTNSVGSSRQLSARERALLAFENKLNK